MPSRRARSEPERASCGGHRFGLRCGKAFLGLPVVRENCRGNGLWKLDLRLGDGELEIFNAHEPPARLSYPEAAGLRHLAFRVDSVAEAVAELAAKGIACEPVRMDEYSRKPFTFFRDPDGLPLELHE